MFGGVNVKIPCSNLVLCVYMLMLHLLPFAALHCLLFGGKPDPALIVDHLACAITHCTVAASPCALVVPLVASSRTAAHRQHPRDRLTSE